MPLFNPAQAKSAEAAALYHLADRVSECENFQELAEKSGAALARPKVIVGPHKTPFSGVEYTADELAGMLCEAQLWSPVEGNKQVTPSDATGERPNESGGFLMTIRRHCREVELNNDRQDLYLFFLDRIAAFETELWQRCDLIMGGAPCPRLQGIIRQQLGFSPHKAATTQGEYLYSQHLVQWGDATSD